MSLKPRLAVLLLVLGLGVPVRLAAQADDISLGDLARTLRKNKADAAAAAAAAATPAAPAKTVIDNDNLAQIMEDVQKLKARETMAYSFDNTGRTFQVSSPDVTCSLSFNANATALLADPFVARNLPATELGKLEGPATIQGDMLQVSVHNGSGWSLREITVILTILHHADASPAPVASSPTTAEYHQPRLVTAAETSVEPPPAQPPVLPPPPSEKRSDFTVLYRLKGTAPPAATTVFQQPLDAPLAPGDDWHWAIVEAKGIPPTPALPVGPLPTGPLALPPAAGPTAKTPAQNVLNPSSTAK